MLVNELVADSWCFRSVREKGFENLFFVWSMNLFSGNYVVLLDTLSSQVELRFPFYFNPCYLIHDPRRFMV